MIKKIVIVGAGAVGVELLRLLELRNFPIESIHILARSERDLTLDKVTYKIKKATPESFSGMDIAFFAGTEGDSGAAKELGRAAIDRNCIVIDNGSDFRMEEGVPLIIPEINLSSLKNHKGIISNPNCSTIIALMAIGPLHFKFGVKRIVATTFQAVSGTGTAAIQELSYQAKDYVNGEQLKYQIYPHQIFMNVIPAIGSFNLNSGETTEEEKMRNEIRKILNDKSINISATCVRVPVLNGHSISLNVEFHNPISSADAREILSISPGVKVVDDVQNGVYPMPLNASAQYDVLIGRIREDFSTPNTLNIFVSGDNIWKGAALNAVQIGEALL
jgi:aspartate-semialdehyde dehydrogenase